MVSRQPHSNRGFWLWLSFFEPLAIYTIIWTLLEKVKPKSTLSQLLSNDKSMVGFNQSIWYLAVRILLADHVTQ